jgi:PAS domain S-box-containing protein
LQAEGWYQNLNGRDRYIIFDAAPVYNSRGELAVVIETLHDATERKKTEEVLKRELDFTAAVLETVGSMVLVLDRQGKIVQFNRTCEEVSGYTFEEVQGKHVWDFLLPPEQVEAAKGIFKNLISGMFPNKYEHHWVAKDGSLKLIAWSNTALLAPDGSVEFVIPTGIDITERERADEALLQHNVDQSLSSASSAAQLTQDLLAYSGKKIINPQPVNLKEGRETILVADDEEAIRGLIKDMLQEFGYAVILAEDGEDALNKFRENRDKIQLLLFDVTMPKKNGKEVYEEIKGMNPAIKAIFLSGYAADLIHRKGVLEEGLNFIVKPFAVNSLLDQVRLVLDS